MFIWTYFYKIGKTRSSTLNPGLLTCWHSLTYIWKILLSLYSAARQVCPLFDALLGIVGGHYGIWLPPHFNRNFIRNSKMASDLDYLKNCSHGGQFSDMALLLSGPFAIQPFCYPALLPSEIKLLKIFENLWNFQNFSIFFQNFSNFFQIFQIFFKIFKFLKFSKFSKFFKFFLLSEKHLPQLQFFR